MLNGREKIGNASFDWQSQMLRKHVRRTIGFGAYDKRAREYEDELYIREISIVDGGLGCALWDGGVILTRWIYAHLEIFADASVLELGAGVALPGILAARVARSVVLTDYMQSLVDNISYNVYLNSYLDAEDEAKLQAAEAPGGDGAAQGLDERALQRLRYRKHIGACATAALLDWEQCDDVAIEPVDIIIGAELTYSLLNVAALVRVVSRFLKPDGVFYEILSTDRDGVGEFVRQITEAGFAVDAVPVPRELMGSYGTSPWTFQDVESYTCYTFRRPECRFPRME